MASSTIEWIPLARTVPVNASDASVTKPKSGSAGEELVVGW